MDREREHDGQNRIPEILVDAIRKGTEMLTESGGVEGKTTFTMIAMVTFCLFSDNELPVILSGIEKIKGNQDIIDILKTIIEGRASETRRGLISSGPDDRDMLG